MGGTSGYCTRCSSLTDVVYSDGGYWCKDCLFDQVASGAMSATSSSLVCSGCGDEASNSDIMCESCRKQCANGCDMEALYCEPCTESRCNNCGEDEEVFCHSCAQSYWLDEEGVECSNCGCSTYGEQYCADCAHVWCGECASAYTEWTYCSTCHENFVNDVRDEAMEEARQSNQPSTSISFEDDGTAVTNDGIQINWS